MSLKECVSLLKNHLVARGTARGHVAQQASGSAQTLEVER